MTNPSRAAVLEAEPPITAPSPDAVPSVRNNFAWTFAGNVLYAGCQWGMLSALAKLGSPEIVGQFTLGLAIGAPVFMFTNLQLRAVQATDVQREHKFSNYFSVRLLATIVGLAVVAGLLPFATTSPTVRAVIFLIAVSKCVECMSDVTAGLLQREEQLRRVAISLMIRGVASVIAFSFVFAYSRNLGFATAAMIGVWLAVLLFYDARVAKALLPADDGFFRFDFPEIKRIFLLSLPLGWIATLQSLGVNIPRYFLQHYMGLADQGVYASLAYLVVVVNLVVYALSQSVTTRLSNMFAMGRLDQFSRLLAKLSMLGLLIGIVGVPSAFVVGRPLLTIIYRREYGDHVGLLALLVGTAVMNTIGSFLFCGVTAAREFHAQVPVNFIAIAIVTLGSFLLIPRWGLMGAGFSVLLSACAIALGGIWVLRQLMVSTRAMQICSGANSR